MSQEHTIGHVGWSPDYTTNPPRKYPTFEEQKKLITKECKDFAEKMDAIEKPIIEKMMRQRRENYPSRTPQDLEIADLKRENNAAFELIQELSAALVALGYDPTSKKP